MREYRSGTISSATGVLVAAIVIALNVFLFFQMIGGL